MGCQLKNNLIGGGANALSFPESESYLEEDSLDLKKETILAVDSFDSSVLDFLKPNKAYIFGNNSQLNGNEIRNVCVDLSNFDDVLFEIMEITRSEKSEIDVLISGTTPEFTAAAVSASFMSKNIKIIISKNREEEILFEEIPSFADGCLDTELMKTLSVLNEVCVNKYSHVSKEIIKILKEREIWSYSERENSDKTDFRQKEAMYYKRHYIDPLLELGWIRKRPSSWEYIPTDKGTRVLRMFGFLKSDQNAEDIL